ncbi:unnamed protein product [Acanthoscelides obtectus]|uniref:Serpin domain-containing protein n=1 Tax=Acanthoscelides obtectus TaxID=200917 RepID=A0A9P0KSU5_ACAOB|nr:unnamed protein product [Acanthoscelides obtectus]CAK1652659.1 Serpin B6 [Acanthoscelides obtectus]
MIVVKFLLLPLFCLYVECTSAVFPSFIHPKYISDNWTFLRNVIKSLELDEIAKPSFVMSPFSLEIVMMMLRHGAEGDTLDELEDAIGLHRFITEKGHRHGFTRSLLDEFKTLSRENVTIYAANRVFLEQQFEADPKYLKEVNGWYDLEVKPMSFAKPVAAAKEINDWVARKTKLKIQNLLQPTDLYLPRLVLVNALYFSGRWMNPFEHHLTHDRTFYSIDGVSEKKMSFMQQVQTVSSAYSDNLQARIVDLPFVSEKVSMTILLTDERNGLRNIWEQISDYADYLWKLDDDILQPTYAIVTIPKFRIEFSLDGIPLLKSVGITLINIIKTTQKWFKQEL